MIHFYLHTKYVDKDGHKQEMWYKKSATCSHDAKRDIMETILAQGGRVTVTVQCSMEAFKSAQCTTQAKQKKVIKSKKKKD